jgi:glycosyltransferase involved in cell wall biosynthesis
MALTFPPHTDKQTLESIRKNLLGKRVAIVAAKASQEHHGGAERFNDALLLAFCNLGCAAELIFVDAQEATSDQIIDNYKVANEVDLSNFDIVISSKVPTYAVPHPNKVIFLNHAVRAFDDMFNSVFPSPTEVQYRERASIHQLDFNALKDTRYRFSQGYEVQKRLRRWRGLNSAVLHPPLLPNAFGSRQVQKKKMEYPFFFIVGRLHKWKRIDLLIESVLLSKLPFHLVIAGEGEALAELQDLAKQDPRIQFVGRISDVDLTNYYLDAIAVPFIPLREDYGYVTLEAFASGKPIITCSDSGEPAKIVEHMQTGLIAEPDPAQLCSALEWAYSHPDEMRLMGERAQKAVSQMSWEGVALRLVGELLGYPANESLESSDQSPVLVMDMQPIDPPIGGGRQRLLGLYHHLGASSPCRYIGTYDWPGEKYRNHMLSDTLTEINIPLSSKHHIAAHDLAKKIDGKVVIDLAFSQQAHLSPEYVEALIKEIPQAQVLVFSHPWVYPLVKDWIKADQVVIYDAHNVEGFLRAQLLDGKDPVQQGLLKQVCSDELELGQRANWILCCSHEDLQRFYRIYSFSPAKMRIVPNGVMAFNPSRYQDRTICRANLGLKLDQTIAVFIGSAYGPNLEGGLFIVDHLAPTLPNVHFIIIGGVGEQMYSELSNVTITGTVEEDRKNEWLGAANFALNPMFSGSGTNIKMFDFMASHLPVITTEVGARGIETSHHHAMTIVEPTVLAFQAAINRLSEALFQQEASKAARACVEEGYAWEHISAQLGEFMRIRSYISGQSLPKFSVVIPSYERHTELSRLIAHLQLQIERDFEVIIVDQSNQAWDGANNEYGFLLTYFHSPVRGAVRARNTGAMLAQGEVIAFIDDDCIPTESWLLNARPYFDEAKVLGLEGRITTDHIGDPDWRSVSNIGSEGIGFMTANLMVRSAVFQYLGGFDLRFDRPHFREDTDFGWRMLDLGDVPHAEDVVVFHPAQRRNITRESHEARAGFFEKDALLYEKHPERYRILFEFERHFERTPGFNEHLLRGFEKIERTPPPWILKQLK